MVYVLLLVLYLYIWKMDDEKDEKERKNRFLLFKDNIYIHQIQNCGRCVQMRFSIYFFLLLSVYLAVQGKRNMKQRILPTHITHRPVSYHMIFICNEFIRNFHGVTVDDRIGRIER